MIPGADVSKYIKQTTACQFLKKSQIYFITSDLESFILPTKRESVKMKVILFNDLKAFLFKLVGNNILIIDRKKG